LPAGFTVRMAAPPGFDTSGESPAYWHYRKKCRCPRERSLRAFSLSRLHRSDGGPPRQDATPSHLRRRNARRRPSLIISPELAGTRERAGRRRALAPARGPLLPRDTVRARNDRAGRDHAAQFILAERAPSDRVSDLARASRPCCDRRVGGDCMSADVIRFIPPPIAGAKATTDFPRRICPERPRQNRKCPRPSPRFARWHEVTPGRRSMPWSASCGRKKQRTRRASPRPTLSSIAAGVRRRKLWRMATTARSNWSIASSA